MRVGGACEWVEREEGGRRAAACSSCSRRCNREAHAAKVETVVPAALPPLLLALGPLGPPIMGRWSPVCVSNPAPGPLVQAPISMPPLAAALGAGRRSYAAFETRTTPLAPLVQAPTPTTPRAAAGPPRTLRRGCCRRSSCRAGRWRASGEAVAAGWLLHLLGPTTMYRWRLALHCHLPPAQFSPRTLSALEQSTRPLTPAALA